MKSAVLLIILYSGFSYGFDYAAYEKETLDGIISKSNVVLDSHVGDEGVDIINPVLPFALHETLEKMPYNCDSNGLVSFMSMIGFDKEKIPPANHCVKIKSKSGVSVTFYVQDTLVEYIRNECKTGEKIQIWAIWVFSNGFDRLPRLLMNEFDASAPNKSSKRDAASGAPS